MIDALHLLLSNTERRFYANTIERIPETAGLDILFEEGETFTTREGFVVPRIVRVGATDDLRRRAQNHFYGPASNSAFRRYVQRALQAMGQQDDEPALSKYIADKFSLTYMPGLDLKELKVPLMCLLHQHERSQPSSKWQGKQAGLEKLWEANELYKTPLGHQQFLQLIDS